MVVVLAIMGIALAIVGPAMILPKSPMSMEKIIAESRSAAIRRSEQITLSVGEDGKWRMYAPRSGADPVRSGSLGDKPAGAFTIEISPLGLCTVDVSRTPAAVTLDPFNCALTSSQGSNR